MYMTTNNHEKNPQSKGERSTTVITLQYYICQFCHLFFTVMVFLKVLLISDECEEANKYCFCMFFKYISIKKLRGIHSGDVNFYIHYVV